MSGASPLSQASFPCTHCQKAIFVPIGLPVTTAACPHCGGAVTSPDQDRVTSEAPEPATITEKKEEVGAEVGQSTESRFSDQETPAPLPTQESSAPAHVADEQNEAPKSKKRANTAAVIAAAAMLVVAGGVTIWLAQKWKQDQKPGGQASEDTGNGSDAGKGEVSRNTWLKEGWKQDATKVLQAFTAAKTPDERMKHVIPNEGVEEELRMYYSSQKDDADTPAASFGHVNGTEQDRERGIFLMQYRQPAQINIREYFAPIGSLEAILGQQETTLIEMAHRIGEDNLSKPIGINAFFKEIDGELKLDASVFIQGKYRTFKLFTSYAQPGKSKMFRVVASESLTHRFYDNPDIRTYRFEDFAYPKDYVNVPVQVNSDTGDVLSQLNWHGEKRNRVYKTATVELEWTDESPSKLQVKRLVCWEFLGVGGEIGNTKQKAPEIVEPASTLEPSPEDGE